MRYPCENVIRDTEIGQLVSAQKNIILNWKKI